MHIHGHPSRGFTIVELLVVISIIMIMLGILFPAMSSVQARSNKMQELNDLRQVGLAWILYSNMNNDAILPGYLDFSEQEWNQFWRSRYEYPTAPLSDPNDPTSEPLSRFIPHDIAAPWTWRLLEYLDYDYNVVHRYAEHDLRNIDAMVARAEEVARHPAFGYNAYHVGGWLHVVAVPSDLPGGSDQDIVVPRFWNARDVSNGEQVNVVSRRQTSIIRPNNLIVFCSATRLESPGHFRRVQRDHPGYHVVTPPNLARTPQWRPGSYTFSGPMGGGQDKGDGVASTVATDPRTIRTLQSPAFPPVPRYNDQIALLMADGSTDARNAISIADQHLWIDVANTRLFRHTEDD